MFQTSFNFEVKSSYQHLGMSWACLKSFGFVSVAFALAHFPFLTLSTKIGLQKDLQRVKIFLHILKKRTENDHIDPHR